MASEGNMADKVKKAERTSEKVQEMGKNKTNQVKDKAHHTKEQAKGEMENMSSKAKAISEKAQSMGKEKASHLKDTVRNVAEEAKEKIEEMSSQIKHKANDLTEKAQETFQDKKRQVSDTLKGTSQGAKGKIEEVESHIVENLKQNTEKWTDKLKSKAHSLRNASSVKFSTISSQAQEKLRGTIAEGAKKLRDTSSSVVESLDSRARARNTRNRVLLLAASGLFIYGFASNLPDAMTKYSIEKVRIQEEATAERKRPR